MTDTKRFEVIVECYSEDLPAPSKHPFRSEPSDAKMKAENQLKNYTSVFLYVTGSSGPKHWLIHRQLVPQHALFFSVKFSTSAGLAQISPEPAQPARSHLSGEHYGWEWYEFVSCARPLLRKSKELAVDLRARTSGSLGLSESKILNHETLHVYYIRPRYGSMADYDHWYVLGVSATWQNFFL